MKELEDLIEYFEDYRLRVQNFEFTTESELIVLNVSLTGEYLPNTNYDLIIDDAARYIGGELMGQEVSVTTNVSRQINISGPIGYIDLGKEIDANFRVLLPQPLAAKEKKKEEEDFTIRGAL